MLKTADQLKAGAHHTRHAELFSRGIDGFNLLVLAAVDKVQSTAPDGGGYFVGVKAKPAESPIGYPLRLFVPGWEDSTLGNMFAAQVISGRPIRRASLAVVWAL